MEMSTSLVKPHQGVTDINRSKKRDEVEPVKLNARYQVPVKADEQQRNDQQREPDPCSDPRFPGGPRSSGSRHPILLLYVSSIPSRAIRISSSPTIPTRRSTRI